MAKYKITYFDIRGLAERVRLVAAIGKIQFEDVRYPFSLQMKEDGSPDFSTMKRDEFEAEQKLGKFDSSMGKVPFVTVDGVVVAQSKACERFLAKEGGLMGSNNIEAAQIDGICECCRDVAGAKEEEKADMWGKVEKAVPGSSGYAVGGKTSLADITIWHMLKAPEQKGKQDAIMGANAKLKAICDSVDGNADLQAYLSKRKETPV